MKHLVIEAETSASMRVVKALFFSSDSFRITMHAQALKRKRWHPASNKNQIHIYS